jgi:hypothetical protein
VKALLALLLAAAASSVLATVLIAAIIKENHRKTKATQQAVFKSTMLSPGYEEYVNAALDLVFALLYTRAQTTAYPPTREELRQRAGERRQERAEVDRTIAAVTGMILGARPWDYIMPNDKALGDCTGAECRDIGGFFEYIGLEVPADELVRHKMTENEIRTLLRDNLLGSSRSAISSGPD